MKITPIEFSISENTIEELSNPVNNNLKTPHFLEGRLRKKTQEGKLEVLSLF